MTDIAKYATVGAVTVISTWLLFAWLNWEPHPRDWGSLSRLLSAMFAALVGGSLGYWWGDK